MDTVSLLLGPRLKHAFIAKFNKFNASVYDGYAHRLALAVVTGKAPASNHSID